MKRNTLQQQAHSENVTLLFFLVATLISLIVFMFGIETNNDTFILFGGLSTTLFGVVLFIISLALSGDR